MSVQRNALIAELLGKVHYIEKAGTGIQRIKDAVAELGKGEVKFNYNEHWFVTTFSRTTATSTGRSSEENANPVLPNTKNEAQTIIYEQVMASVGNASEILTLIKTNPKITAQKIAHELGITSRSVEKQISVLKQFQIIERLGSTKGVFWKVL